MQNARLRTTSNDGFPFWTDVSLRQQPTGPLDFVVLAASYCSSPLHWVMGQLCEENLRIIFENTGFPANNVGIQGKWVSRMSLDAMTDRTINSKFPSPQIEKVNFVQPVHLDLQRTQVFQLGIDQPLQIEADQALQVVNVRPSQQTTSTQSTSGSALNAIVSYIPTEVVVTYVAILAALGNLKSRSPTEDWVIFWIFLAFTPLATWTIYAVKYKGKSNVLPIGMKKWPWWNIFSASLAFSVWAYALPGSPFTVFKWYRPGLGTAGLLFVSFLLGMVAPLFQS